MRPPIVTRTTQTDTGCMEFNGYRNDSDYGIVRRRGQKFLAHRWARGTDNPNARITEDEVAAIRRLHADREANQYQIAAQFGLAQTTVSSIVRNKSWRHVS